MPKTVQIDAGILKEMGTWMQWFRLILQVKN